MNNREKLNQMSDEEIADMLCTFVNDVAARADIDDMCDLCPVNKLCKHGCAGFITWLKQEAQYNA